MSTSHRLVFLITIFMTGCATSLPPPPVTWEEQVRRDNALGGGLAPDFERQISVRKDVEVSIYLRKLAERLTHSTPNLAKSPVGVFVIRDRTEKWRCYGLPGNRVYLSTGLVKSLEFENELAAAIAIELAHILNRDVAERLPDAKGNQDLTSRPLAHSDGATLAGKLDYFGPSGIFAFSEEEVGRAIELGVDILYKAGVDPRGMIALWKKYAQIKDRSPYEREAIARFLEKTRQTIALYAPLRNPIVRSDAFLTIHKRIRTL